MDVQDIKVLLVGHKATEARMVLELPTATNGSPFAPECVGELADGLSRLARGGVDVVLLDLFLPDSQGLETFYAVYAKTPEVPVVVLTPGDETLGVEAVGAGAQDCFVKGSMDAAALTHMIRCAIARQRLFNEYRALSYIDELTGLYNRRGFLAFGRHQLKLADRNNKVMLLFFIDLDYMKCTNDTLGHIEGDRSLIEAANVLRYTFRETDIMARVGGDEFVVLALEARESSAQILIERLQENLNISNTLRKLRCELSLSVGVARYDPALPCSIEELLARADRLMYEQKREKPQCNGACRRYV